MKRDKIGTLASMAWRNLFRHRVKTIITITAVAVSVTFYIFVDAWLTGMNLDSKRNIVNYETGAAKVQLDSYFAAKDDLPMYENFSGASDIVTALAGEGFVAAPRFVFTGTAYSRAGNAPLLFNAVDADAERSVLDWHSFIDAGEYLSNGTRGVVIGMMAADKLHVGIPQKIAGDAFESEIVSSAGNEEDAAFIRSLYMPYRSSGLKKRMFDKEQSELELDGMLVLRSEVTGADISRLWRILAATGRMDIRIATTIDVKDGSAIRHVNQLVDAVVVGVVNSPNPVTNGNIAYIPLDSLQDETGLMLDGTVTEILVRFADSTRSALPGKRESAQAISAALDRGLSKSGLARQAGLSVRGWQDYVPDYFAASAGDNVSSRLMIFFLFVLSFIGIANTMLMAILERTKEIGMMRALGMTDRQLVFAYVIEASLVGFVGSAIGLVLGTLINIPMINIGIDYSSVTEAMNGDIGYRVASYFRSAWNVPAMIGTFVVATVLSGLMAIAPTVHALKMSVTDSLRFE